MANPRDTKTKGLIAAFLMFVECLGPAAAFSPRVPLSGLASGDPTWEDTAANIVAEMQRTAGLSADPAFVEDVRRQVAEAESWLQSPRHVSDDEKDAYNFLACGFVSGGLPIPGVGNNAGAGAAGYLCADFLRIRPDGTTWRVPHGVYFVFFPKAGFTQRGDHPKGTATTVAAGGGLLIVSFDAGTTVLGEYLCANISAPLFKRMGFSGFLCGRGTGGTERPHLGFVGGMWGRESGLHTKGGKATFGKF